MKKKFVIILAIIMLITLSACTSRGNDSDDDRDEVETQDVDDQDDADDQDSDEGEDIDLGEGSDWPTGAAASAIPVFHGGTIMHVTEHHHSDFIMIAGVSKDEAKNYWQTAHDAGFTNIVSKSENQYYDGFTYVATNEAGISLSVTWSPGHPSTMTLLAILP